MSDLAFVSGNRELGGKTSPPHPRFEAWSGLKNVEAHSEHKKIYGFPIYRNGSADN